MGGGYHGGFGKTYGTSYHMDRAFRLLSQRETINNLTREDIIKELSGVTETSSLVAKHIEQGDIKINIISDALFNRYITDGHSYSGVQIGNQIYIKNSAKNVLSVIVHEGNHALDVLSGMNQQSVSSREGELRSFVAEHNFQKAKGMKTEFTSVEEIKKYIIKNY